MKVLSDLSSLARLALTCLIVGFVLGLGVAGFLLPHG